MKKLTFPTKYRFNLHLATTHDGCQNTLATREQRKPFNYHQKGRHDEDDHGWQLPFTTLVSTIGKVDVPWEEGRTLPRLI